VRYFVALHEIGHVAAEGGHRDRRIDREVAAWSWALGEARCPLTPAVRRHIAEGLRSYVNAAANRRLLRKRALPTPDDAVWCLLEAMDPGLVAAYDGRGFREVLDADAPEWSYARRCLAAILTLILASWMAEVVRLLTDRQVHLWTHVAYQGVLWTHWAVLVSATALLDLGAYLPLLVQVGMLAIHYLRSRPRTMVWS
jgi:hypothetical protein